MLFLRDFRHLKRQIERKMQTSDPYGPSPKSGKTSESDFNAMLLRNKAMLWHVCSDYNIGMAWNAENCMQEVIISLWNAWWLWLDGRGFYQQRRCLQLGLTVAFLVFNTLLRIVLRHHRHRLLRRRPDGCA